MLTPVDVLVAVPAHDEASLVPACLESVGRAIAHARHLGVARRAVVVVSAHRCTDATASVARAALEPTGLDHLVITDEVSTTVGEVRDRAVRRALDVSGLAPASSWLLSTDADSVVPRSWVVDLLRAAEEDDAVAVAGMTELVDWDATAQARAQYAAIISAGIVDARHHRHVYAANLAVRLDAYLTVGGFPAAAHGEETGLVQALHGAGLRTTSTRRSVVRTSGRMPGRAAQGLGALLAQVNEASLDGPAGRTA